MLRPRIGMIASFFLLLFGASRVWRFAPEMPGLTLEDVQRVAERGR